MADTVTMKQTLSEHFSALQLSVSNSFQSCLLNLKYTIKEHLQHWCHLYNIFPNELRKHTIMQLENVCSKCSEYGPVAVLLSTQHHKWHDVLKHPRGYWLLKKNSPPSS